MPFGPRLDQGANARTDDIVIVGDENLEQGATCLSAPIRKNRISALDRPLAQRPRVLGITRPKAERYQRTTVPSDLSSVMPWRNGPRPDGSPEPEQRRFVAKSRSDYPATR
jgi:hypothetical protein